MGLAPDPQFVAPVSRPAVLAASRPARCGRLRNYSIPPKLCLKPRLHCLRKIDFETQEASGHDFSRAVKPIKSTRALAPDGVFSERSGGFHRLQKNSIEGDVLKGHGFSRAANAAKSTWALTLDGVFSERSGGFHRLQKNSIEGDVLKGHDFSRAEKYPIKTRALAPEGSLFGAKRGLS